MKHDASSRGRRNRSKGHSFERLVANELRSVYPAARRSIGQARNGGEAPDIEGTPFWVECGTGESVTAERKMRQADGDAYAWNEHIRSGLEYVPLAVTQKPRGPVLVTMHLADWLDMARLAEKAAQVEKLIADHHAAEAKED